LKYGVINKTGNSYAWGDRKLGFGREAARLNLKNDPKLMADIKKSVLEALPKES